MFSSSSGGMERLPLASDREGPDLPMSPGWQGCNTQMAALPGPQLLHSWQQEPQPLPQPWLAPLLPGLQQETCEI